METDWNTEIVNNFRSHWPIDVLQTMRHIKPISTMSTSRMKSIIDNVKYIVDKDVPGDVVELGVFKGGNIALCFMELYRNSSDKHIWAYDTYDGVPKSELTNNDVSLTRSTPGDSVLEWYDDDDKWCYCDLETVKNNWMPIAKEACHIHRPTVMKKISDETVTYVQGSVLDTIPATLPKQIAFLLLDMDIEQPTRHVLPHVWPLIPRGGIVQVDDYNKFGGVHLAVDEFFADKNVYIQEIDYTAINIVKLEE